MISQQITRRLDAIPEDHADANASVDAAVLTYVLILMVAFVGIFAVDCRCTPCKRIKVPGALVFLIWFGRSVSKC